MSDGTIIFEGSIRGTSNGTIYVANWLDYYLPGTGVVRERIYSGGLTQWSLLTVTPSRTAYVYIDDPSYSAFESVLPAGSIILDYQPFHFISVFATTADFTGNVYDMQRRDDGHNVSSLVKTTPQGAKFTYPGDGFFSPYSVSSMAADSEGDVYVSGQYQGAQGVYKEDPAGNVTTIVAGVEGYLAVDSDDDLYINSGGTLYMTPEDGQMMPVATGVPNGRISTPVPEPGVGPFLAAGVSILCGGWRFRQSGRRRDHVFPAIK